MHIRTIGFALFAAISQSGLARGTTCSSTDASTDYVIFDHGAAQRLCPQLCSSLGKTWNGNWTNLDLNGVCGCQTCC